MIEKTPTRRLILDAVIDCIDQYGIDKVTTRKIAKQAGTNIASINYYFRSKDELVAEAMSMSLNHMMEDVIAAIEDQTRPFDAALVEIFFYLIDGSARFPGITAAHLYAAVMEKRHDSLGGKAIGRVFEKLVERAVSEYSHKERDYIRFLMAQIVSSLLFSGLAPGFFSLPEKFQPVDAQHCRTMAEQYAKIFFASL